MAPDEYTMWLERALTGRNAEELERAYAELLRAIKRIDPLSIAESSGGHYLGGDGVPRVLVPFLHSWFVLDLLPYRLRGEHREVDTLPLKVLALQHLIAAAQNQGSAVRVMGQWIDARSLQHGAVLGAHFARSTVDKLGNYFSLQRETRIGRALACGGKPVDLGEEAYQFNLFPRLPVVFVHWFEDPEFGAYSKILYDVSASNYMPTHGLIALTEFLIHRLADTG